MTGGYPEAGEINRRLAQLAAANGLGMAVGSQHAGLENPSLQPSYEVVRKVNPDGLIWANLSARASAKEARQAVDMIAADGIQLHLNLAQELAMLEGDRDFSQVSTNLWELVHELKVPVIAKETGNGIALEEARELTKMGITTVDVGGHGGTNFINIENQRGGVLGRELEAWGLPTAISLLECLTVDNLNVIASGGIRSALDAAKCLALGAEAVGMALPFLHLTAFNDEEMLVFTQRFIYQLKAIFLLCGARNLTELRQRPLVISGKAQEWMQIRGLKLAR